MSKLVRYPNGYIGVASDKAAEILARKPGHCIVAGRPDQDPLTLNSQETLNRISRDMHRQAQAKE
jgi:hypothetical protein